MEHSSRLRTTCRSSDMTARKKLTSEIARLSQAIAKTDSVYIKNDYRKAIRRKIRELKTYDKYQREAINGQKKR